MEKAKVSLRIGSENFKTEINTADHHFLADEPNDKGGLNTGPKPTEYLLAALGSCTVITLKMYCNHKNYPVEEIKADVLLVEEQLEGKTQSRIQRKIYIVGQLPEAVHERLLRVAESCPVHKLLSAQIAIESVLETNP